MPITKSGFAGGAPEMRAMNDNDADDSKVTTIKPKKKGQKSISFKPGGLHESTDTPQGKPIPPGKMAKALAGGYGPKAEKQAAFAKNVLSKGGK